MPIIHIGLFKVRPDVTQEALTAWLAIGNAMAEKIPGLAKVEANTPLPGSESKAQGYNLGVVVTLETMKDLEVFATHPAHDELKLAGKELFAGPPLVYEFEVPA
ncbi:hypothetical protein F5Y18DRAFT_412014 [Xylariaceae sp. FL1019]|nr:hypothetical protein F5Y18DRAFT_412014 [Xylariaceae sp. FL1019]